MWHGDRLGVQRRRMGSLDNTVVVPWDVIPAEICVGRGVSMRVGAAADERVRSKTTTDAW